MMKTVRNIMVAFLAMALLIPTVHVKAANKYVSKKTITTTVDYDEDRGCNKKICIKAKDKKTVTNISVKIVKMTGKADYDPTTSQKKDKMLALFDMASDDGIGCLAYPPKEKFKKGATFKLGVFMGNGYFSLDKPYGVKSVTYKFTFKSKGNKKTIKSVSVKDL